MSTNNLMDPNQYGFIAGKSCKSNLIDCCEDWSSALGGGDCTDIIYLDFQKAFDTVPHQRLLKIIQAYGISGTTYEWIKDFLHDNVLYIQDRVNSSFGLALTSAATHP
jgi:sarcosine oxidase/L-pipecolate oxidase